MLETYWASFRYKGIARQLRAARFDNGALRIDNVKVTFGIDEEGFPEDCSAFVRKEANELIEEVRSFSSDSDVSPAKGSTFSR